MKQKKIHFTSPIDQEMIHALHTEHDDSKVLVVFLHGMAEHKDRYLDFVRECSKENMDTLLIDHRGHGESLYKGAIKGHFAENLGWYTNTSDLKDLVNQVNQKELPIVLFGHSMGSLFARSYLKHYPKNIKAVYLSGSPDYSSTAPVARILAQFISMVKGPLHYSKFLNDQVFKAFNKSISNPKTDFDWLSYNHDNVVNYINDDLCGFMFTTKAMEDLAVGLVDVYKEEKWTVLNPETAIHFISGIDDPTHRPKGLEYAVKRMNKQGYSNVNFEYVENARHEIYHEDMAKSLRQDFIAWIQDKVVV